MGCFLMGSADTVCTIIVSWPELGLFILLYLPCQPSKPMWDHFSWAHLPPLVLCLVNFRVYENKLIMVNRKI